MLMIVFILLVGFAFVAGERQKETFHHAEHHCRMNPATNCQNVNVAVLATPSPPSYVVEKSAAVKMEAERRGTTAIVPQSPPPCLVGTSVAEETATEKKGAAVIAPESLPPSVVGTSVAEATAADAGLAQTSAGARSECAQLDPPNPELANCTRIFTGAHATVYSAFRGGRRVIVKTHAEWPLEHKVMDTLREENFQHMPKYAGLTGNPAEWLEMEFLEDPPWVALYSTIVVDFRELKVPVGLQGGFGDIMRRFRAVARSVKELHDSGWVHADLHGYNVFVHRSDAEQVKLIDFGDSRENSLGGFQRSTDGGRLGTILAVMLTDELSRKTGLPRDELHQHLLEVNSSGYPLVVGKLQIHGPADLDVTISEDWREGSGCELCRDHEEELRQIDKYLPRRGGPSRVGEAEWGLGPLLDYLDTLL